MPFNLLALAAMGVWVWANRRADRWLLYGGLAIMTRLWAYHQLYDDMLNLFAFIALIRLAGVARKRTPDQLALIVLLIAMTTLPGPATPLRFWYGSHGWISLAMRGWQNRRPIPHARRDHASGLDAAKSGAGTGRRRTALAARFSPPAATARFSQLNCATCLFILGYKSAMHSSAILEAIVIVALAVAILWPVRRGFGKLP